MKVLFLFIISIFCNNLNAQLSDASKSCFQELLNNDRFIDEIKKSDIKYCNNSIFYQNEVNDTTSNFYFQNTKLASNKLENIFCSSISFKELKKNKFETFILESVDSLGSRTITFNCKVKVIKNRCYIKKIDISRMTWRGH